MQVKDIDDIVIWAMCPYCEEEVELYSVREQPCPRCGLHFRRILNALLMGARLTPQMANEIGVTTEGTRIIRKLRELYPINKEKVTGSIYYRYWIDEAFLKNRRNG